MGYSTVGTYETTASVDENHKFECRNGSRNTFFSFRHHWSCNLARSKEETTRDAHNFNFDSRQKHFLQSFNMYFSKQSLLALLALPAMASAGVRGTKTANKAHRQLTQTGKQEAAGTSFCTPNPLFVGVDGLPRYIEDKVVLAIIEGVNSTEVDMVALSTTMGSAYNAAVNCSFSPGAIRELMGCEVIEGAAVVSDADTEAYLIRCKEFFSNSVDNAIFLSDEDMYAGGICECSCGQGEEIFAQLVKNGECDCPCGSTPACECYAPFVDNFISGWNMLFTAATLNADITVSDVIEVAILDPNECNAGVETTFNGTAICPGNGTAAFASK
jgi:hypothetical protein